MMLWNAFRLALRAIRRNLMRSGLTTLGIVVGVAAVILMVTLGRGATKRITADISGLGRNLLVVVPGTHRAGSAPTNAQPFDLADAEAIAREVSGVSAVAPTSSREAVVVWGTENRRTQAIGTDEHFLEVRTWTIASGRGFTEAEIRAGKLVCLVGDTVRREVFGAQDPVGATVRLGGVSCRVVGVLGAKGQSTFGQDQDDLVLVPLRAFQRRFSGKRDVGQIYISARTAALTPRVQEDVQRLMRQRRHVDAGDGDDFTVRDLKEVTEVIEKATGVMTAFLGAIAAISLVVGGIGIMNIMLVSVTERTREIGTRLAVGALGRDVLLQFLVESALLSSLGGAIGIAVGLGGSLAIGRWAKMPFVFDPLVVAGSFLFSALVGVAFGFLPARKAARLDPIDALRHE